MRKTIAFPLAARSFRLWLASAVAAIFHTVPSFAQTPQACPDYPPMTLVMGAAIYKEGTNSIPDAAGASENKRLLAPVRDFLAYEGKAVDKPGDKAAFECPYQALEQWANAGALLGAPDTPGRVARVWISAGVGFIVLKYKMRGVQISPAVAHWLSELAATQRRDYGQPLKKGGYAGLYSNVYPWSAVTNAASALVSGDPEALRFQDEAWSNMIAEIQPDGSLRGEMARGQRALEYHQKAADGLLALHALRKALGRGDDPQQIASLKRLLVLVGDALCNPDSIAQQAGAKQDIPGVWGFRGPYAFGGDLLPATWKSCGPKEMSWFEGEYSGGDARVAAQAVAAAAQH